MTQGVQERLMTAILAVFAHFLTLPSVLAESPNQTLPIILGLVVVTAMAVGCAVALKKS
jgi:hypothetical protein